MTLAEKVDKAVDKAIELGKIVGTATASAAKTAASVAKEKSEQVIEIGKLKKDILVEKGKISENYEEIGKLAYIIYCSSKDYSGLESLLKQIGDSMAKIDDCNKKIEEVKKSSQVEVKEGEDVFGGDDCQAGECKEIESAESKSCAEACAEACCVPPACTRPEAEACGEHKEKSKRK